MLVLILLEKNEENILHVSFYREIGEEKMGIISTTYQKNPQLLFIFVCHDALIFNIQKYFRTFGTSIALVSMASNNKKIKKKV